jgi:hypothetical protein
MHVWKCSIAFHPSIRREGGREYYNMASFGGHSPTMYNSCKSLERFLFNSHHDRTVGQQVITTVQDSRYSINAASRRYVFPASTARTLVQGADGQVERLQVTGLWSVNSSRGLAEAQRKTVDRAKNLKVAINFPGQKCKFISRSEETVFAEWHSVLADKNCIS